MFQGLSPYNYDFAIAAIPLQLLLMLCYGVRRNLPIRQSRYFLTVMLANLTMTVFDIVSCEMNEIWQMFPLWMMYLVNLLYFVPFIMRGWALAGYTSEVCQFPQTFAAKPLLGTLCRGLVVFPSALALLLILSSPWTGAVFAFGPEGYANNPDWYPIIYVCTYFYIGVSLLYVLIRWRHMSVRLRISTIGFNLILLIGIICRKLFFHVLVTSYVSILTILVIYLSSQNPDLYRDRVTKLFNRDAFSLIGADLLRRKHPFYCVILNAHNYETAKLIYGFHQLNRSLELAGTWMIEQFPDYYVFYFENGNYLLLYRGRSAEHWKDTLKTLNERFAHPWKSAGTEVSLSLSALVLPYDTIPQDVVEIRELLRYAFGQAYPQNQKGITLITRDMLLALGRQKAVEAALSNALREHRLMAYFQPIYSVAEHRVVGAEALARLNDPVIGPVSPEEFIHVAERTGEIMELGRQVFEQVCDFIEKERPTERGLQFFNINLSPAQCQNEQLCVELSDIAAKHGVPMSMFDFEITESSAGDSQMVRKQMIRLQQSGAVLSIDDFGNGTSNLSRLMKLPIHIVKLDMSIVRAYFAGDTHILPELVRMFQGAGLEIVVEGVETREMADSLASMGCDYLQGYFFSRPIPPEAFLLSIDRCNKALD